MLYFVIIDSVSFILVGTPRSRTNFIVHVWSNSIQVLSLLVNVYCKKCNLQGNKDDFDFIIPLDKDSPTFMRLTLIRCHAQFVKTYTIDDADERPLIYSQ